MKPKMYEILCSQGQGLERGPKFQKLADALRYVSQYAGSGSVAIRCPDGGWYRWGEDKAALKKSTSAPESYGMSPWSVGAYGRDR